MMPSCERTKVGRQSYGDNDEGELMIVEHPNPCIVWLRRHCSRLDGYGSQWFAKDGMGAKRPW